METPHLPGIEPDEILALYAMRTLAENWRTTALGRPLDRLWMKLTATGDGQGALIPMAVVRGAITGRDRQPRA